MVRLFTTEGVANWVKPLNAVVVDKAIDWALTPSAVAQFAAPAVGVPLDAPRVIVGTAPAVNKVELVGSY